MTRKPHHARTVPVLHWRFVCAPNAEEHFAGWVTTFANEPRRRMREEPIRLASSHVVENAVASCFNHCDSNGGCAYDSAGKRHIPPPRRMRTQRYQRAIPSKTTHPCHPLFPGMSPLIVDCSENRSSEQRSTGRNHTRLAANLTVRVCARASRRGLSACSKRPRCRAAQKRDELPPLHALFS